MSFPRFYSLPPRSVQYPYLLINMHNWKELWKRSFEHAILDCGVEIFKKHKNLKDYPKSLLWSYTQRAEIVSNKFHGKVWVTIPDYPDDICPGMFGDNIERTLRNIEEFIKYEGVEWLPVLQTQYLNLLRFYEACHRLHSLIGDYPRVAIGTVCKTRRHSFIVECCRIARQVFAESWIHGFGLTLDVLPKVAKYINSFDSLACYFPRTNFKAWSAATGLKPFPNVSPNSSRSEVAKFFFEAYLKRLEEIKNQVIFGRQ